MSMHVCVRIHTIPTYYLVLPLSLLIGVKSLTGGLSAGWTQILPIACDLLPVAWYYHEASLPTDDPVHSTSCTVLAGSPHAMPGRYTNRLALLLMK